MEKKAVTFSLKSIDEQGVFSGYAAAFGNVDAGGDIILRGAFQRSLNNNGGDVPISWQHRDLIGKGIEAHEDDRGLFVRGQLNLEVQAGREAFALAKQGAVKGLSIEYQSLPSKTTIDAAGHRILHELKWLGYSLVTHSMNESATIIDVKAQADQAEALEMLRGAHRELANFYKKLVE